MPPRALLAGALALAVAGAASPPLAVDVAPRQLTEDATREENLLAGVVYPVVDWLLCRHASTAFGGAAAPPPISLARSSPGLSHPLLRARSSPWALVTNFFLSASTSTALLETLAALLLPAGYELSCGFVVVEMMVEVEAEMECAAFDVSAAREGVQREAPA